MAPPAGGRVQGAAALRGKKKTGPAPLPSRIANAEVLRSQYIEILRSPDGADPEPLTVPKCVECAHCGWPVYPRDSRLANRKTFERAGIKREEKKEKKEKKERPPTAGGDEHGGLDIGDDEEEAAEDDEESVGTVARLEERIEELDEEVQDLTTQNAALTQENAELTQRVEDLDEALSAAEEKIVLLEESELRWREKNSVLRVENADLRLYINQLGNRIGDLETDMVSKILEIKWRREEVARIARRRNLMLTELEKFMRFVEGAGTVAALFTVWKEDTARALHTRRTQDLEARRRLEVGELTGQLGQEKEHVLCLQATAARLRGSLKAAAQRLLGKVCSTTQKPWADGHALRAWAGAHQAIKLENEHVRTQQALAETRARLASEEATTAQLETDLDVTTENLKSTAQELDDMSASYSVVMEELQKTLGSMGKTALDIQSKAEEKARAAKEALTKEIWAEANKAMANMAAEFENEKLRLGDENERLQAEMEGLRRALGCASGEEADTRVVPKGQGVLCCGCLKQIVNRGVKQLPPVEITKAKPPDIQVEKKKKLFFEQELQGMPDPDDVLHSDYWKTRRDPLVGLRYSSYSAGNLLPSSARSISASRLSPLKMRERKIFKPVAFR